MSRVYFHSEAGEAELRGSERAYAAGVCRDLFISAIGLTGYVSADAVAKYLTLLPANHYLQRLAGDAHQTAERIRTSLAVEEEFFTPTLNTALVMGSDTVKLLARLHGQCEIHGYIEGGHRAWLAGIVERGRESKVLREKMGWEEVATLLRSASDAPVIMSYSVCESFPNPGVAGWKDNHDGDDWYDLPKDEQWRMALQSLREENGLQIQPDDWDTFYFGNGATAFDLLARLSPIPF